MPVLNEEYDVVVVGAGHAGCEAALASARLGLNTIIFTVSMDSVAMMPCNPNVGGSSKGHLVREIDALGGEMGKNIDKTYIQSKMLNASKGPAVHSLRAQADKANYSRTMKHTLENTDNLTLRQAEVSEIIIEDNVVKGVKTYSGATYFAKAVVLCTGTYLKARCIYGDVVYHTGPNGLMAANYLSDSMKNAGIEIRRFKTGTPARLDKRTIDFSQMEVNGMSQVKRIFVEKKDGFNVEAKQILWDLRHNLGVRSLTNLRFANRYDVAGLTDEEFAKAKVTVFSEPNQDTVYDEEYPVDKDWKIFAMEYLPGQYDQRADSASQCVQLLTAGERPQVISAKVVSLEGDITDEEFEKIKSYMINPVESRVASLEKPESLDIPVEVPENVARITDFIKWNDEEMEKYYNSMGFAMTLADLKWCRDYFRDTEKRDPSVTELRVIDTYWSDHCRHTTFLTRLDKVEIEKKALSKAIEDALQAYYDARDEVYGKDTNRNVSLMDMALMGMKLLKKRGQIPDLDESEEINACSINVPVTIDGVTENWLLQFKNETHNHPTEIEPFGGAATCLGGAIRDPLSGRSYVYQAMRVTGSGDPTVPFKDTMHGKLPSRKITTGAAQGYSSYGNQIGICHPFNIS